MKYRVKFYSVDGNDIPCNSNTFEGESLSDIHNQYREFIQNVLTPQGITICGVELIKEGD